MNNFTSSQLVDITIETNKFLKFYYNLKNKDKYNNLIKFINNRGGLISFVHFI